MRLSHLRRDLVLSRTQAWSVVTKPELRFTSATLLGKHTPSQI